MHRRIGGENRRRKSSNVTQVLACFLMDDSTKGGLRVRSTVTDDYAKDGGPEEVPGEV